MRRKIVLWLCLLLCLPVAALGEDFLVSDEPTGVASIAQTDPQGVDTLKVSSKMQAAIAQLDAGSYLDALNAFSGIDSEESAPQYAAYAQAKLMMLRENPVAAINLYNALSGFLDSEYQLALTNASRLHRAMDGDRFGYVNESGVWKIAPQFDWAERTFRLESAAQHDRNVATYAPEELYTVAMVFNGETEVTKSDLKPLSGKYGLVRSDGVLVAPVQYESVLWAQGGIAAVTDGQSSYLYNIATAKQIGGAYEAVGDYAGGYIPVKQNGLWGYLQPKTEAMLGEGYVWETALPFSEGKAGVSQKKLYGYIDDTGALVIPLQFSGAASFGQGFAGVKMQSKWGFINTEGTVVIKQAYSAVNTFQSGLCAVRRGSSWGVINKLGEIVLRVKYSEIGDFDPIYHRAWIRQNKLWGLFASTGAMVLKPAWGTHDEFNGNTLCRVSYKKVYGFIDAGGKTRIQNIYKAASPFTGDFAAVTESNGQVRYISKAQRTFTLATTVPVECRNGFIEGRTVTVTQNAVVDTAGESTVAEELHIAFALFDASGNAIPVSPYAASPEATPSMAPSLVAVDTPQETPAPSLAVASPTPTAATASVTPTVAPSATPTTIATVAPSASPTVTP